MDDRLQSQSFWSDGLRQWILGAISSAPSDSAQRKVLIALATDWRMHRVAERLSTEEQRFNAAESGELTFPDEKPGGTVRAINYVSKASRAGNVWDLHKKLTADRPGLEATRDAIASLLKLVAQNRSSILFGIEAWNYGGSARRPEERLAAVTEELRSLEQICDGLQFYYPDGGDALPANNKKTFCIRYLRWETFASGLDLRDQDIADTVSVVSGTDVTEDDVRKAWKAATAYMRRPSDIPM